MKPTASGRSANTPRMIDAFEATIGVPYPYARYSQIAVAEFIFGGMENTAATTQTDRTLHDARAHLDFSSDPLVSHELAHQWFGDLVTCRDWSQAWLNEGFATYFEAVWRGSDLGWDEYRARRLRVRRSATSTRTPSATGGRSCATSIATRSSCSTATCTRRAARCCTCCAASSAGSACGARCERYVEDNAAGNVETIDLVRAIERSNRP